MNISIIEQRRILDVIRAVKESKTWNEERTKLQRIQAWEKLGLYEVTESCLDGRAVIDLEEGIKEHYGETLLDLVITNR